MFRATGPNQQRRRPEGGRVAKTKERALRGKMSNIHIMPGQFRDGNIVFSNLTSPEMLRVFKDFEFRDSDVLVAGYPKSGTTWVRYLIALINNNGKETPEKWTVMANAPILEAPIGKTPQQAFEYLRSLPSPRIIGTHLPSQYLGERIPEGAMKIVVVMRNPKDTLVSFFHFYRMTNSLGKFKGSWDQFFEMFRSGSLWGGNVIQHHIGWWRYRHQPNVLVVRYEEMKKDLGAVVKKLAAFCGKDRSGQVLDDIAKMTTFDKMEKNLAVNNEGPDFSNEFDFTISKFMRKGQIGDWKNYFSDSQNEYVSRFCGQMAAPVGLCYDFE